MSDNPHIVSLWSKTFEKYILHKDHVTTTFKFKGQPQGGRDHMISDAKIVCSGDYPKRKYAGNIISVVEVGTTNTRNFIITIENSDDKTEFRTKNELCRYLCLSHCDDNNQGITRHYEI